MKKLLLMSIALLGLSGGIAQAAGLNFEQTFENATRFIATIEAKYPGCRNDTFTLAPGTSVTHGVGWCNLSGVSATVSEELVGGQQVEGIPNIKQVTADPYDTKYSGSSTWTVYGPVDGQYKVRRTVK